MKRCERRVEIADHLIGGFVEAAGAYLAGIAVHQLASLANAKGIDFSTLVKNMLRKDTS